MTLSSGAPLLRLADADLPTNNHAGMRKPTTFVCGDSQSSIAWGIEHAASGRCSSEKAAIWIASRRFFVQGLPEIYNPQPVSILEALISSPSLPYSESFRLAIPLERLRWEKLRPLRIQLRPSMSRLPWKRNGFVTLVNATSSDWNLVYHDSYHMKVWNGSFPTTIPSGTTPRFHPNTQNLTGSFRNYCSDSSSMEP